MTKVYPLGLVAEQHYQSAVEACREGERVYVCHEPDNPYDDLALKVETAGGRTIGYVPKECWLRNAIHEQGRGVTATILSIEPSPKGFLGVVLNVTLTDDEVRERAFDRPEADQPKPSGKTGGADLIGKLVKGLFK